MNGTVAIVEDEENIRDNVSFALKREGYHVESYTDGLAACEAFEEKLPDLAILDNVDPTERARLDAILWGILPISARAQGLILDAKNTASPLPVPFDRITAPTLAASAEDDRYVTAASARLITERIAGAELLVTPDGGHVWAGRRDEVWDRIRAFLTTSGISPQAR